MLEDVHGAALGLVEQISKFDGVTRPSFHLLQLSLGLLSLLVDDWLARCLVQDYRLLHYCAKLHMVQRRLLRVIEACFLATKEDQFEVELLALVRHIDDAVSLDLVDTVSKRCHISCIVVKATVRFLNDQRHLVLRNENTDGSIVFNSDAVRN